MTEGGPERSVESEPVNDRERVLFEIGQIVGVEDDEERAKRADAFVGSRLEKLISESAPRMLSLLQTSAYEGFIHPESEIKRNFIVPPFRLNDPELYDTLIESFRSVGKALGKTNIREMVMAALGRTIGEYFGNYFATENTEAENRTFYLDQATVGSEKDFFDLKDFKGKGFAVCAEKAAAAENILSFLGFETKLLMTSNCRLGTDEKDTTGHAYNVLKSENGIFIIDVTNPIIFENESGKIYSATPASYKINEEEYAGLMSGGEVAVTHFDAVWNGKSAEKKPGVKRIYGGPK